MLKNAKEFNIFSKEFDLAVESVCKKDYLEIQKNLEVLAKKTLTNYLK